MKHRRLSKEERDRIKKYICYSLEHMRRIKLGKEVNFQVLEKVCESFPEPGLVLRSVSLDIPDGLFNYYKKSIKKFKEILMCGEITDCQALRYGIIKERAFRMDPVKHPEYYD